MEFQEAAVLPRKQAKSQTVKPKHKRRTTLPPISNDKEQPFVHKKVFGSVRNPNLEEKTISEKPKWRTPSLKPSPITATPKEPVYKPVPKPKMIREEPITKITQNKSEPVQITPSTRDVSQKTSQNSKNYQKEPKSEPSEESVKPLPTPLAKETHQKMATNSKSVPKNTTKPSPKSAKPVQTFTTTPEVFKKPFTNLKTVPNKPIIEPIRTTPAIQKASTKPKMEQTIAPSSKPTQESTFLTSPKIDQSVQTTPLALEIPLETDPYPKPVQNEPISEQVEKGTTHLKAVQGKPTNEIPPKTGHEVMEMPKKTASISKPKKKKSVSFPEGDSAGLKTPGLARAKPRVSGTPYYTAKRCSKCRFDKLERSSYWLGLIKVAENAEKHTVSAGFFNLALEAKPEPFSALKVELKKYMSRHGFLSDAREWNNLTASYGLKITPNDYVEVQASENGCGCDQEHVVSYEQNEKQLQNNLEDRI